ncbi:MAG: hypothetical protein H0U89_08825 [Acidimicrobiia bacterium]|nr:hypothetical protein [Acidimicrobiia bacterium]
MHQREDRTGEGRSALRRWGPLALVLAIVAGVTAVAFTGGDDGADGGGGGSAASTATTAPIELPEGVVTWSMAQADDLDVEFPDTCDEETGRIAIPFFFRTECFADVEENGGATAPGVTADSIKVVAWLPAEDDPVRSLLLERIGFEASNEELKEVYEGFVEIFQRHYQTYGREVELEFIEATGTIFDSAAARADAVRADEEMGAFAVLGGPVIGSAWTDELHARGIVCIACPGISGGEPTVFTLPPSNNQIRSHMANYVSRKLAGKPAEFAGEELQDDERVFGHLALGLSEGDQERAEEFEQRLADVDVDLAEQVIYPLDPSRAAELATSGIASMQAAGVTSVLVQADPILLPAFTQEATKQQWFPEWVLAAPPFVDTTAFARTFDQEQWAHAFGLSYFPPPVDPEVNPPIQLYEWFYGSPPPVEGTIPLLLLYPQVTLFFTGLEYAGPDLTAETFRDGLFVMPPTPRAVTQPQVNYGEELGEEGIYAGIEDMVEVWWDSEGEGPDEAGDEGRGVYRYVDGARRSSAEDWTDEVRVFDADGAVTAVEDLPEDEVPPDYPSPADD